MVAAPGSGLSESLASSAEMEYGEPEQDEPLLDDVWLTVLRWSVTQSEATSRLDLDLSKSSAAHPVHDHFKLLQATSCRCRL